ncbi:MAG: STAS domain-containing protein [Solirubrobacteraceae bacterium]
MPDLELEPAQICGAPGIAVRGELDMATAPELEEALDRAVGASVGAFVLDLCDVSFLDSSAINLLMRTRALLGREDRTLVVVCPPGSVRRVFALTGIEELFALFGSRDEAARALVPVDPRRRPAGHRSDVKFQSQVSE